MLREALIANYRANPELAPMPGAVELVRALSGRYPLAVASGSVTRFQVAWIPPQDWAEVDRQL